jgi:hypothetical protein
LIELNSGRIMNIHKTYSQSANITKKC